MHYLGGKYTEPIILQYINKDLKFVKSKQV